MRGMERFPYEILRCALRRFTLSPVGGGVRADFGQAAGQIGHSHKADARKNDAYDETYSREGTGGQVAVERGDSGKRDAM